jgi:hypothetical protein
VILFRLEDLTEQVPRYKIAHSFAVRDTLAQDRQRVLLQPKIAFEDFLHALADQASVELLQIRRSSRKWMRSINLSACFPSSIDPAYS